MESLELFSLVGHVGCMGRLGGWLLRQSRTRGRAVAGVVLQTVPKVGSLVRGSAKGGGGIGTRVVA